MSTDDLLAPAAGALRRERAEIVESLPPDMKRSPPLRPFHAERGVDVHSGRSFSKAFASTPRHGWTCWPASTRRGDGWLPRSKMCNCSRAC